MPSGGDPVSSLNRHGNVPVTWTMQVSEYENGELFSAEGKDDKITTLECLRFHSRAHCLDKHVAGCETVIPCGAF